MASDIADDVLAASYPDTVELGSIVASKRHRPVDEAKIKQLAESIAEVGLLHPIVVTADMRLIAGAHRLAACKSLGWETVDVYVKDLDDLHAELAEIDENLFHAPLSIMERAQHLARRKEIYEALHPVAKAGKAGAAARWQDDEDDAAPVPSFTADTAEKTGVSPRTAQRLVQIGEGIPDDVADTLKGVKVSQRDLEAIARMSEDEQRGLSEEIRSQESPDVAELVKAIAAPEAVSPPAERASHVYRDFRAAAVPGTIEVAADAVAVLVVTPSQVPSLVKALAAAGMAIQEALCVRSKRPATEWAQEPTDLLFVATRGFAPVPSAPCAAHVADPLEVASGWFPLELADGETPALATS